MIPHAKREVKDMYENAQMRMPLVNKDERHSSGNGVVLEIEQILDLDRTYLVLGLQTSCIILRPVIIQGKVQP